MCAAPQGDPFSILAATRTVVEATDLVRIDLQGVEAVAAATSLGPPSWNTTYHYYDGTARSVAYTLILDSLNFCFWGEPTWRVAYQGAYLTGYWALAAALKRAFAEGFPLDDAATLMRLTRQDLLYVLRGEGIIPLFEERLAILHEVGRVLEGRFGGSCVPLVEGAQRSAIALVHRVVEAFPSFRDVAQFRGSSVRFYKRAQILAADLWGIFGGQQWGEFADLEQLTAFADYKLPQVLRHLGILHYREDLAAKVRGAVPLEAGSEEEVAIRAATLWAVELLRQALAQRGRPLRAFEVDWCLWEMGQQLSLTEPHHRTRTIFY